MAKHGLPSGAPLAEKFRGIRVRLRPELRQAIDGFAVYFVCVNHATAALLPHPKERQETRMKVGHEG
jgi:hypothetical protein